MSHASLHLRALCPLATRTALPCHGAELFDIAAISTSGDSIFPPWPEFLRPAERPSRISAADFASLPSESAPFQLLLPTRWIRAVSWPPHALTRVCVLEERRGAQGDTAGIETGEAVRGSATGKQQLLAVLLQLRKHRGGGGFCILYLPYWQSGTPDTFAQKRCVFEEGRGAQGDTAGIETGETVRGSTTGKQQLLAVLLLLRKHRGGGGSGGPARLLRASRHDFGCLEVSGGPARLLRASRHEFGCL